MVVGNPDADLAHAEAEAQMVADALGSADSATLLRDAANRAAVFNALPGATHVHLACQAPQRCRSMRWISAL